MGQRRAEEDTVSEEEIRLIRQEIRSPQSAAIAGIIFSILLITGMLLSAKMVSTVPASIDREWLEQWPGSVSLVVTIVPFFSKWRNSCENLNRLG